MAETTIQWTDYTFNPWVGCQRVSPGCEHCYAESYDKRVGGAVNPATGEKELRWGPTAPRIRTKTWKEPLKWNRKAAEDGVRRRVFCASLADVFEDRPELVPWRADLFGLIMDTPHLDWLILTKRPENILRLHPERWLGEHWMTRWPNVWFGTTVEDQRRVNERLPHLLRVPAMVRFLSCEPLLQGINIGAQPDWPQVSVDWVIIGGESGGGARPFHVEWGRSLIKQTRRFSGAPFVKQLGAIATVNFYDDECREWYESQHREWPSPIGWSECDGQPRLDSRVRLLTGDDRSGGELVSMPPDLRVREFPTPRTA